MLLAIPILTLAGCKPPPLNSFWAPNIAFAGKFPDDGSSYSQGLVDGCTTQIGSAGMALQRLHPFTYDPNRAIEDREYYRGYVIGRNHCMYMIDVDPH
ncbi:MAG: hypothetical protein KDD76_01795 [Rickettsiales bacterium]|nr:hypothetical protein [Rickettsiales bacterium]